MTCFSQAMTIINKLSALEELNLLTLRVKISNIYGYRTNAAGIPCRGAPPCVLFATHSVQSPYYPGDVVKYSCISGYTNMTTTTVRCGIEGQWVDPWPTCIRKEGLSSFKCLSL